MIALPVASPPVNDTRSTRGSVVSGRADVGAGAGDQVGHAGRQPGLGERVHQQDGRRRGELAGLEDEGVAGQQGRGDLPGRLQQRVVPRRDQRADADRGVDDAADGVGSAGVDHPTGVGAGDPAVVAETADDVVDVVLGLDQPLAGVQRLGGRVDVAVPGEQVGHPQQQRAALALRGGGPVAGVERPAGGGDRGGGVAGVALDHRGDQLSVRGTADLAAGAARPGQPAAVDVQAAGWSVALVGHLHSALWWALSRGPSRGRIVLRRLAECCVSRSASLVVQQHGTR